jgi:hypothetical protein
VKNNGERPHFGIIEQTSRKFSLGANNAHRWQAAPPKRRCQVKQNPPTFAAE